MSKQLTQKTALVVDFKLQYEIKNNVPIHFKTNTHQK